MSALDVINVAGLSPEGRELVALAARSYRAGHVPSSEVQWVIGRWLEGDIDDAEFAANLRQLVDLTTS